MVISIDPKRSVMYVCCRDGNKKEVINRPLSKTGQVRKHVDTRKLGKFCISRMMATECLKTGKVNVTYISSHTNHLLGIMECKYLPLPLPVKNYVQQQFAAGVTMDRIINGTCSDYGHSRAFEIVYMIADIRGEIGSRLNRENFLKFASRKHFITRQDSRYYYS